MSSQNHILTGRISAQVVLPRDDYEVLAETDEFNFSPVIITLGILLVILILVISIKRWRHVRSIYHDR